MKARDICLRNNVKWSISINGRVEIETIQELNRDEGFYHFKGTVRNEDELESIDYRLRHRKAPD